MATSVGQISLDLVVNKKGFDKQMKGIGGLASKAGAALASALDVKKLVDFSAQCISLGSDLAEVQNVVDSTFTTMSEKVNKFARNATDSFGLSETMAKKYTGTFGVMAKAFGFNEAASYDMSTALTGLSGDMASFYNISQDEAFTKLKSVFTGETESLKDLGVVMTQTALDQFALANGFGKTAAKMSEAEKVALRYVFVQKQLTLASGDFAKTSDSWANQVRILSLRFDSLKATIGQGLINVFKPVIQVVNAFISKLQVAADKFKAFTDLLAGKKQKTGSVAQVAVDAGTAKDGLDGITDAAKKAAKATNTLGIDELNIVNQDSESGSSSGSSPTASSVVPTDTTSDAVKQIDTMATSLGKVKQLCIDIGESFKTGFLASTAYADFSGITTGLDSIGTALQGIITDADLGTAATSFITSFSEAVGTNVGAVVAIGTNIASNIITGIKNYLNTNGQTITDKIISIFNSGTKLNKVLTNVGTMLAEISGVLTGSDAISITTDLVTIFGNGFLTAIDIGAKFGSDLISAIAKPITDNKESIKTAIEGTLAPIATVVESIKTTCDTAFSHIYTTYDTYIKPAIDAFSSGFNTIFTATLDAYNTYLAPALQSMADAFAKLMSDHITPLITAFEDFAGAVILAAAKIWEETLAPFVAWIIENLAPPFSEALGTITTLFTDIAGVIADTIAGALTKLGEFATWISDNQGTVLTITGIIAGFFAAWEVVKLLSFIQQSGGVVTALGSLLAPLATATTAIFANAAAFASNTAAKIADKAQTVILTAMYAKDFVVSLASGTAALITQAAQWIATTAVKVADTAVTIASTVATTAATVATWAFNAALAVLTSPITLVIAAIVALIAIGVLLYKNWDEISAKAVEIFTKIKDFFIEVFKKIKDKIVEIWDNIKDGITSKFTAIKDGLSTALDNIKKKWDEIWTGLKTTVIDIFSSIWTSIKGVINSILGGIESMANGVIKGINKVISAMNGLSFDIPDWVPAIGGKTFGFNLPSLSTISIPKLAEGGYVKANTPQLAMIGDNRTQGEIVAPEGKLLQMALQAAKMVSDGGASAELLQLIVRQLGNLYDAVLGLKLESTIEGRELKMLIDNEQGRAGFALST
ncbi:MAG: hypothetical protein QM644_18455 [Mobilitalea sp.]